MTYTFSGSQYTDEQIENADLSVLLAIYGNACVRLDNPDDPRSDDFESVRKRAYVEIQKRHDDDER